eukprot:3839520-Alexandrium_andersonii.AAC.1
MAVGTQLLAAAGVLPAYGSETRTARMQAKLWSDLKMSYPQLDFCYSLCDPPYQDGDLRGFFFERG